MLGHPVDGCSAAAGVEELPVHLHGGLHRHRVGLLMETVAACPGGQTEVSLGRDLLSAANSTTIG